MRYQLIMCVTCKYFILIPIEAMKSPNPFVASFFLIVPLLPGVHSLLLSGEPQTIGDIFTAHKHHLEVKSMKLQNRLLPPCSVQSVLAYLGSRVCIKRHLAYDIMVITIFFSSTK